ncbi:hypothetical protein GWK47_049932 [Chionoecetes opilio]|uniref:Uncharacterized protein n=1 Tax=Chionoecetes opilio TaxID=41210 RepID=A0A8J5CER7_CHIOP|nr:hypothetical protein GWK47_049932 [Chionoecetes opilio]
MQIAYANTAFVQTIWAIFGAASLLETPPITNRTWLGLWDGRCGLSAKINPALPKIYLHQAQLKQEKRE